MVISQEQKSGWKNPWLLGILVLVIIVLAVNAGLIWMASHNGSALVDREYKAKNRKTGAEFLSELGSKQALGWKATINRPAQVVKGEPTRYELNIVDPAGRPVSGEVTVEAYRAADATKDFSTRFNEVSLGNYQEFISFPLKGYWELHVRVVRGDELFTVNTDRFMVLETR
jgi:nitrogen fixation protein FixH